MRFLDFDILPLGLGCWPLGGAMFDANGSSLAYSGATDNDSIEAIAAARANGISVFDTAAAYGAGHSERILGRMLGSDSSSRIITKIGVGIDENTKQLSFAKLPPNAVIPAIEHSLRRLKRDCIDLLLLHQNSLTPVEAESLFDEMDKAVSAGKISAYGWSTDFASSVQSVTPRPNFKAVEHAMNVLLDAPTMQKTVIDNNLYSLIRSPLAMGLLSGKYNAKSEMPGDDIRARNEGWLQYFNQARPNPAFLQRYDAVGDLLQSNGRTPVQGALAWLWAKNPRNIPLPGARTAKQVEGLAGALALGPLDKNTMQEIESLILRDQPMDREERER